MARQVDFASLAIVLGRFRDQLNHPTCPGWVDAHYVRDVIVPLSHRLRHADPRFDYVRFLAACGVQLHGTALEVTSTRPDAVHIDFEAAGGFKAVSLAVRGSEH